MTITPITGADLSEVGAFLSGQFADQGTDRISAAAWTANLSGPWTRPDDAHGLQLRDGTRLVGVYVTYDSPVRETASGHRRIRNLADWAVLEEYRAESIRLVMSLLADRTGAYTDLTARPEVAEVNRRLGFREIDADAFIAVNLPSPMRLRARVLTSDEDIRAVLPAVARGHYVDHRGIAGLHAIAVADRGRACLVLYRERSVALHRLGGRRVRVAAVIHASDRGIYDRTRPAIVRHLLRRGYVLTWSDTHVVGRRPKLSRPDVALSAPRMFRGPGLTPADIDYLYSEVVFG